MPPGEQLIPPNDRRSRVTTPAAITVFSNPYGIFFGISLRDQSTRLASPLDLESDFGL